MVPAVVDVAQTPFAGEQGSYGLIVLVLATWLIARAWPAMRAAARPGAALPSGIALGLALALYLIARIAGHLWLEAVSLYGVLLAGLYLLVGLPGMRPARFALVYALLALPPGHLLSAATAGLRTAITDAATAVLHAAGLQVAKQGFTVFIDQYRIEIVDACAGMNSIVSIAAIGLFYVHMRGRRLDLATCLIGGGAMLLLAVAANFVRVLATILITHGFGPTIAQGPLHEAIGLAAFALALGGVFALDALVPQRAAAAPA